MSSSWWMLIRSRLPDPVGGFIFIPVRKVHQKISLAAVMQRKTTRFRVCTNDRKRFIIKEKRLEGYGNDNPGSKSQGMKQLMAGGGVALVGITLIPLLSGLFG